MSLKSYTQFLNEETQFSTNCVLENFLNEGGAYGHISHPFEDIGLTMSDLREMIEITVNGGFSPDNFVQTKTDGQNIMISWKDGKLVAARNKSHLKNAGENALDSTALGNLFAGRGDIEKAYNAAMQDLSASISKLSEADKNKFFDNGKKFASVEVITPITQNTVPYGQNLLVFHGIVEHDELGNAIGEDKQAGRDIGKLITDANAAAQKTFFVRGPEDIATKPFPNTAARLSYYIKKLDNLIKDSGVKPNSTVGEYAIGMAKNLIQSLATKDKKTIPSQYLDGLAKRIADIDKAYTAVNIKKDLGDVGTWFLEIEKNRGKELKRDVYAPLESIFLEIGTEMLKNISTALVANPTQAAIAMKNEIDTTINKIRTNGDETDVAKLETQLKRLNAVGGLDDIVPSEGITFVFKGKLYKYTGVFAIAHQIRSILAFKK